MRRRPSGRRARAFSARRRPRRPGMGTENPAGRATTLQRLLKGRQSGLGLTVIMDH